MKSSSKKNLRLLALAGVLIGVLVVAIAVVAPGVMAQENCVIDAEGANDEPGQKDLTRICTDYDAFPTLALSWQWDEVGTPGANSLDACALFDSDNDGNANYALCAETRGNPATLFGYNVYTCNDANPDRCSGYTAMANPPTSSCAINSPVPLDPFPAGSAYPNDAEADCTIDLNGFGAAVILLDVCSYPSNPGSDPSDCIVRAASGNQLIVRKVTDPGTAGHIFDFSISPSGQTFQLGNGDQFATGPDLAAGSYTISEQEDIGWTTSIQCDNGLSLPAGNNAIDVTLAGAPVACTFTNVAGPTSVQLADFTATAQANSIVLNWETVNEINNVGFNVFRGDSADAAPAQISPAMIPSAAPGSAQGSTYVYEDVNVVAGATYYYWLQDTDTLGKTTVHGPLSVTLAGPTSVGLNSFSAAASSVPTLLVLGSAGMAAVAAAFVARRKRG